VRRKDNALEYRLTKKDVAGLKQELQDTLKALDRAMGKAALIAGDTGDIITVYPVLKRRKY
jgi:hypothetical protein